MSSLQSWRPEVRTDSTGQWYGNNLRFATEQEALDNVHDLANRWFAVIATRVVPTPDPPNYSYVSRRLTPVTSKEGTSS